MPLYTSVTFRGHAPISMKFDESEAHLMEVFRRAGSAGMREALGISTYDELRDEADRRGMTVHALLHQTIQRLAEQRTKDEVQPYSGWPAGAKERLADAAELLGSSKAGRMLDPFAGRANFATLAAQQGMPAFYCEVSPVFERVGEGRIGALFLDGEGRVAVAAALERLAAQIRKGLRTSSDSMLEATREQSLPAVSDDRRAEVEEAGEFLMRLRSAIDALELRAATGIAEAAVVEALPRTTGELSVRTLSREVRRELMRASAFVVNEPPLRTRPQMIAADVRELERVPPLAIDLVISEPPSLNFVSYSQPVAAWFLGVRRARPAALLETSEALRRMRSITPEVAEQVASLAGRVERQDERMARIVANYFLTMAESFAAVAKHLTEDATVALDAEASTIAGVEIATPEILGAIWAANGSWNRGTSW